MKAFQVATRGAEFVAINGKVNGALSSHWLILQLIVDPKNRTIPSIGRILVTLSHLVPT